MVTALQFSGGKDSLACLHLFESEWDDIYVVWVNTGAAYPDVIEYMEEWRQVLPNFVEVKTDQPGNIAKYGWPADVVPINSTSIGRKLMSGDGPVIQDYLSCCGRNIWAPMQSAMKDLGATRIIRGQRADDSHKGPLKSGQLVDGVEYVYPLENWSEQDVFDYLRSVDAQIPSYYAKGEVTGRDCWDCTAYLEENVNRIQGLPDEKRVEMERRISLIDSAISSEWHGRSIIARSAP
ncbi:phosphoadenosine phosphosulfate reductase family protein [Congregibacter variabilis]|uniref:Phosphoadenosine phosphosulfate reductase family protein n=1 Tax=Congregibacter variabilis TaxID=3081200 RepID=A0ABZ0I2H0_9GAMM|nr:phosphoadenosine phosphosulfate reductase family protein [Congregibacter sp. IMCC43200]